MAQWLFGFLRKKNVSLKLTLISIQWIFFQFFNVVVVGVILVASSGLENQNSPLPCTAREKVPMLAIHPSCGPLCTIFCLFHSTKASTECYNLWEQSKQWDIDVGGDILDKRSLQVSYSLNAFQSKISDLSWLRSKFSTPSDSASSSSLVLAIVIWCCVGMQQWAISRIGVIYSCDHATAILG